MADMTRQITYPDITDEVLMPLRVLRLLYKSNPDLFDRVDCPYTAEQIDVLKPLFVGGVGLAEGVVAPLSPDRVSFLDEGGDRSEILARQIALALGEIDAMSAKQHSLDQKDRVAFLKAKPGLLEKLVDLNEKTRGQKAVGDFMRQVYAFIDTELDADQRTALIKRIGAYLDEQPDADTDA